MDLYSDREIEDILNLHFRKGLSYAEIGNQKGKTKGAIAGVVSRNRHKYKKPIVRTA